MKSAPHNTDTLNSGNATIQGLWIGAVLHTMQQLSIRSFLVHGHQYHLYAYEPVANIPGGTILKDAALVLPKSMLFKNSFHDTYAAFSDLFRYKLLHMYGGWWADLDMICLRAFDFPDEYAFASEHMMTSEHMLRHKIGSCVIKTPRESPIMNYALRSAMAKEHWNLGWDELGPDLIAEAITKFSLESYVKPPMTFCPLPPLHPMTILRSLQTPFTFSELTYGVHLWHELWRRENLNVDSEYDASCLYEQLKRLYPNRPL